MTDLQLILTISIPSLLVILSWIQSNTRLTRLDMAIDTTNHRIKDAQRVQHGDMMNLHGEMGRILEEISKLRERASLLKTVNR